MNQKASRLHQAPARPQFPQPEPTSVGITGGAGRVRGVKSDAPLGRFPCAQEVIKQNALL